MAKRARGRIVLHGHLPDEQLEALTKRVRASVFVSLAEGYGLPAAESLWRGKPCLCSREGSIAEIAQGGGCLQVDPRSLDEIEAGFETLATDFSRYDELLQQIATRRMKSWKEYADEIVEKLAAYPSERRERPEPSETPIEFARTPFFSEEVVAGASRNDRGVDDGSRHAISIVSASDLTVHKAFASGRTRSLYYNSAIRYDHAQDGAVRQKILFYGPYATLPAGRFAFAFDGEIDGELGLAFTANAGALKISQVAVSTFNKPVIVELPEPVEKFEIIGTRTPSLRHLVLRCVFAEYRGFLGRANDRAASASASAERTAESESEAENGTGSAPSRGVAIPETEKETSSAATQPDAAQRAEKPVYARDVDGNALSLPFVLPADKMRVHDAFGSGAQNRLRENSTISFEGNTHADVPESRLFFGPYLRLEPGDYSFRFRGTLDGSLRLRFTKAFGAECLREVIVTDFEAPVRVSVEATADQFEIVGVRLKNMRAMRLSSIELAVDPLASGPTLVVGR